MEDYIFGHQMLMFSHSSVVQRLYCGSKQLPVLEIMERKNNTAAVVLVTKIAKLLTSCFRYGWGR